MTYEKRSDINEVPAHVQRMIDEHAELVTRHRALDAFLCSGTVATLDVEDQRLLHEQTRHMAAYCAVLATRLSRAGV